jgi:hypothetical protein
MRVAVINCSAPAYNLGAKKLADWRRLEGDVVTEFAGDPGLFACGFDLVALSGVFSWHVPVAEAIALRVKDHATVWAGGPGFTGLVKRFRDTTGIMPVVKVDKRFDQIRNDYKFCFASRGCPSRCSFCVVWRIEGTSFTLDWNFRPAPVLCDNNLSALPIDFQEHIIATYQSVGMRLKDANSGFEPKYFDEATFHRWEPLLGRSDAPYRFALDEAREIDDGVRMMGILRSLRPKRKRVWILVGDEPISACYERAQRVLENDCEPYCQFIRPTNAIDKNSLVADYNYHDWPSIDLGLDFCRYYNGRVWRKAPIWKYEPRADGRKPFRFLEPATLSFRLAG